MRVHLNPIMVGLLAAALPGSALPADSAQTSPPTRPGIAARYSVPAAGIDVTGTDPAYRGDNVTQNVGMASDPATTSMVGLRVTAGGQAMLSHSALTTLGDGAGAFGVVVTDATSLATLRDTHISSRGVLSHGVNATLGGGIDMHGGSVSTTGANAFGAAASTDGTITLDGTSITTSGDRSHGLSAEGAGATITARDVSVSTSGSMAVGVQASDGANITLEGGSVTTSDANASGIYVTGATSRVSLTNTVVNASSTFYGVEAYGGTFEMNGGSVTARTAVYLRDTGPSGVAASARISNAALIANGRGGLGVDLNSKRTSAVLENVSISSLGPMGGGVWLPSEGTVFSATVFDITSNHIGIDNRAGDVTLVDGTVKTLGNGAHGLYVSREYGTSATARATRVAVQTQGDSAIGVLARLDGAAIVLEDSSVATQGNGAHGLFASGARASLTARHSIVTTSGANAAGVVVSNGASVTLDQLRIATTGAGAVGLWSSLGAAGQRNTVTVTNGIRIDTQDGTGMLATGADHTFQLTDATITARAGGNADGGVLLRTETLSSTSGGVTTNVDTGQVTLDATRSLLTGDVVANNGTIDVSLKSGSVLTGAMVQHTGGRTNSLTLDADSIWNMRGDSALGTLTNPGIVAFAAPAGATGFKTLKVNNYVGGGTLVLNAQLGNDASATDKLVIDGGAATGNTSLRIVNSGGTGGQTQTGIRVVQTVNGGSTTADAFRLDAGSTGYRASAQTLALNGYEYSLVRGGNAGVAADWYLTSDYTGLSPAGLVSPAIIAPPTQHVVRNVSPESGAYLGNRLASAQFFTHGLRDRTPAYGRGDTTAYAGGDAGGDASVDGSAVNTGRGVWTRVQGRQDSGLSLSQGRVAMDTDSAILQLGGDLIQAPLGQTGAVYAGLMGGYGDARTTSTSTLMLPGGATVQAGARGKVSGYSVGMYSTVYQNNATRLGAYADTWLQYGRYSNQINSELGSTRYHSTAWSASIETGYALAPFAPGSSLEPVVIEPHAQLVYNRYHAQDATLQDTRMRSGNDNAWNSRIGVRLYPQATANAPAVRPFLEANWLHSFGNPSVNMGPNSLDAALSRNSLELKLGAEGRVSRAVQVSGHVFGQAGSNNQRGYGGMFNVGYRW